MPRRPRAWCERVVDRGLPAAQHPQREPAGRTAAPGSPASVRRVSAARAATTASTWTATAAPPGQRPRRPRVLRALRQPAVRRGWVDTDFECVALGYVAVTPLRYDLLDAALLAELVALGPRPRAASGRRERERASTRSSSTSTARWSTPSSSSWSRFATRRARCCGEELPDEFITAGVGQPLMTQMERLSPEHAQRALRRVSRVQPPPPRRAHPRVRRHGGDARRAQGRGRAGSASSPRKSRDTTAMAFRRRRAGGALRRRRHGERHRRSTSRRRSRSCSAWSGWAPRPAGAIYVGDSPVDIQAGAAAGIATAAVAWGVFGREALLAAAPDFWLDEPAELLRCACTARAGA